LKPQGNMLSNVLAGRETHRILKFLVVGAMAFLVDLGALSAFALLFSMDPTLSKAFAFALSVLASFVGNYYWTYRDSRSKPIARQLVEFSCVSIVGLGINLAVFHAVYTVVLGLWGGFRALYAGEFVAVGASLIWNFFANRLITYNDVR
jgi:putative flippase GtrA